MIKIITSSKNTLFKRLKLIKNKPNKLKKLLLEGPKSLEHIKKLGLDYVLYVCEGSNYENEADYSFSESLFLELSETVHSQGVLIETDLPEFRSNSNRVLVLDRIQDPGNMGTILRSACAFGFNTVYILKGSVSIYSQKVLRSSTAALLSMSIKEKCSIDDITELKREGYAIISSSPSGKTELKMKDKLALIIGNESAGISDDILKISDYVYSIETNNKIDSLNAAVAASIMMSNFYEIKECLNEGSIRTD